MLTLLRISLSSRWVAGEDAIFDIDDITLDDLCMVTGQSVTVGASEATNGLHNQGILAINDRI